MHITLLGYSDIGSDHLAHEIINCVNNELSINITQHTCTESDMPIASYQVHSRDDNWTGKISVQLSSLEDVKAIYAAVHGRGVCVNGILKTLEVSSPAIPHLGIQLCMCTAGAV